MHTLSGNSPKNQPPNGLPRHIFESDESDLSDGAGGLGGSHGTDDSILEHAL